jgi:hypothetical protein
MDLQLVLVETNDASQDIYGRRQEEPEAQKEVSDLYAVPVSMHYC